MVPHSTGSIRQHLCHYCALSVAGSALGDAACSLSKRSHASLASILLRPFMSCSGIPLLSFGHPEAEGWAGERAGMAVAIE